MAQRLQYREQTVGLKLESVEGTAETLDASDFGFEVFEVSFTPDVEQHERNPFRQSLGQRASIAGNQSGTISFETDLVGSGAASTTPPPWAPAVVACGYAEKADVMRVLITPTSGTFIMGEPVTDAGSFAGQVVGLAGTLLFLHTVVGSPTGTITGSISGATATVSTILSDIGYAYIPDPGNTPSATVEHYLDGLRQRIRGARGNLTIRGNTSGAPVRLVMEFQGPLDAHADANPPAGIVKPTLNPPQLLDAGLEFQGFDEVVFDSIEINSGNELDIRRDGNDPTGFKSTIIADRSPSGSFSAEATRVADHDYIGNLRTNFEGPLFFSLGTTNNQHTVIAGRAQITNISMEERGGIALFNNTIQLNEGALPNDDLAIITH